MQLSPQSSPHDSSFLVVNFTSKFQREHGERGGEIGIFQLISRRILEVVQDLAKATMTD